MSSLQEADKGSSRKLLLEPISLEGTERAVKEAAKSLRAVSDSFQSALADISTAAEAAKTAMAQQQDPDISHAAAEVTAAFDRTVADLASAAEAVKETVRPPPQPRPPTPEYPPVSAELLQLLGPELLRRKRTVATSDGLKGKKFILLYFCANWNPACRAYTANLAAKYAKHNGAARAAGSPQVEVVAVSFDHDAAGFARHLADVPWLGIPFPQRARKTALAAQFEAKATPALVVLDAAASVINKGDAELNSFLGDDDAPCALS